MNRRGFLKTIAGVSAAVVAAPRLLLPPPNTSIALPERKIFLPPEGGWLPPGGNLPPLVRRPMPPAVVWSTTVTLEGFYDPAVQWSDEPVNIVLPNGNTVRAWMSELSIGTPYADAASMRARFYVLPQDEHLVSSPTERATKWQRPQFADMFVKSWKIDRENEAARYFPRAY